MIGNVYLLTKGVAKLFNSGKLAGCVVSDELLQTIERYAAGPDKGKKVLPGVGCQAVGRVQGARLRGRLPGRHPQSRRFRARSSIWPKATEPDDWKDFIKEIQYSQPDEFFFFEHNLGHGPERREADQSRIP